MKRLFHIIYFLVVSTALVIISGCAGNSLLPAGTIRQIPSPVIEQETVLLSPENAAVKSSADEYFLGKGDVLFVNISGKPEFSSVTRDNKIVGSRVDGNGAIHLPIIGTVPVAGLTIEQAQERIREAANRYLKEPWVVAEILEYKAKQVFVFGAVKKPGPVPLMPAGLNIAQAIATAELRDAGPDIAHVRIIRSLSATRGELIVLDFRMILNGDALPFSLKDGDIVYVPKNAFGTWNDAISEILPSLQLVGSALQPFVQIKYLRDATR